MALPMDVSIDVSLPWPGYVIYRDVRPDQVDSLSAPPVFYPAKDSDELFDALRVKYPLAKTHSERMRDAIIEFLIEERTAEQLEQTTATDSASYSTTSPALLPLDSAMTSPWQHSWPSMSSNGSSTWSSPDTLGLTTPTFGNSPQPQAPQMKQQCSSTSTPAPSTNEATPAALEQMTGVFSLSTSSQPKQRIRRKMTEAEKVEYRKRRIVKACEKCAKRKRKCQHNQPEMEYPTPKSSNKTNLKSRTTTKPEQKSVLQNHQPQPQLPLDFDFDFDMFGADEPLAIDDPLFGGLPDLFEDQVSELNLDERKQFDTLIGMDPVNSNRGAGIDPAPLLSWADNYYGSMTESMKAHSHNTQSGRFENAQYALTTGDFSDADANASMEYDLAQLPDNSTTPSFSSSRSSSSRRSLDDKIAPKDGWLVHEPFPTITAQSRHNQQQQQASGSATYQDGQVDLPLPTHTAHAHDTKSQATYVFDSTGAGSGILYPNPSLPQAAIRLTSTAKAIEALGLSLECGGSTSRQSISREGVATALANGLTFQPYTERALSGALEHSLLRARDLRIDNSLPNSTLDSLASSPRAAHSSRPGTLLSEDADNDARSPANAAPGDASSLISKDIGDNHFRDRSTHTWTLPRLCRTQKFGYNPNFARHGATSSSANDLASTSVPASRGAKSQRGTIISTAQEGRPKAGNSLAGSIDRIASPSTELYMLRRRTPGRSVRLSERAGRVVLTPRTMQTGPLQTIANGGAYPRLNSNDSKPATVATARNPAVHTRLNSHTTSGADNGRTFATINTAPLSDSKKSATPHEDRLSDHVRYRDHHGRPAAAALFLFTTLVVFNLSLLPLSFSFLALLALVQCSAKNSSWLYGTQSIFTLSKSHGERFPAWPWKSKAAGVLRSLVGCVGRGENANWESRVQLVC